MEQKTGTAATLSIVAAAGSYILTFTGHPLWAFLSAILALPLGIIGLLMAASPRVSGGILSLVALGLGALAIILSVLGMLGSIVF